MRRAGILNSIKVFILSATNEEIAIKVNQENSEAYLAPKQLPEEISNHIIENLFHLSFKNKDDVEIIKAEIGDHLLSLNELELFCEMRPTAEKIHEFCIFKKDQKSFRVF